MATLVALLFRCGLVANVNVLAAIVSVESGGNPLAIAVNGDYELVRQPRDLGEAVAMARWLAEHGHSFDAGLAQLNSANLDRLGLDTKTVFDPCTNLRAASRFLEECHERAVQRWREPRWRLVAAVSCYNTGDLTRGIRNGYVAAVLAAGGLDASPGRVAELTAAADPGRVHAARAAAEPSSTAEAFGARHGAEATP